MIRILSKIISEIFVFVRNSSFGFVSSLMIFKLKLVILRKRFRMTMRPDTIMFK